MEGDNSGHKVQDVEQESVTKNNSPLNSYKNDTERSTCSVRPLEIREAPNGKKLIIVSVYAPQELREKKMIWDYLILVLKSWNGDVIIMGDFNEVRTQDVTFRIF
ncbi:RNA-directed DNA polymerase, eukaryota, partial [Tanacetum coccineum]